LTIFDPVIEMEAVPAILRDEWRGRWIHGRNFPVRGERVKPEEQGETVNFNPQ
jgi:hypothetical protein